MCNDEFSLKYALEEGLNMLIRCVPNITLQVEISIYKQTGEETGQVEPNALVPVSFPVGTVRPFQSSPSLPSKVLPLCFSLLHTLSSGESREPSDHRVP